MTYPTPTEPGWYWAKLTAVENPDDRSSEWEAVRVWDNIMRPWCEADIESGECMMASVPGLEQCQPLEDFIWGPRITMPEDLAVEEAGR